MRGLLAGCRAGCRAVCSSTLSGQQHSSSTAAAQDLSTAAQDRTGPDRTGAQQRGSAGAGARERAGCGQQRSAGGMPSAAARERGRAAARGKTAKKRERGREPTPPHALEGVLWVTGARAWNLGGTLTLLVSDIFLYLKKNRYEKAIEDKLADHGHGR